MTLRPYTGSMEVLPSPPDLPDYLPDGQLDPIPTTHEPARAPRPTPYAAELQELRDLQSTWGHFLPKKARIAELLNIGLDYKTVWEAKTLIRAAKAKIEAKAIEAVSVSASGVDWPYERVEHFIRELTRRDGDHAQERNDIGWGPQHSSAGHWCNAMLDTDREAALRVGRTIVGGYERQIEGKK